MGAWSAVVSGHRPRSTEPTGRRHGQAGEAAAMPSATAARGSRPTAGFRGAGASIAQIARRHADQRATRLPQLAGATRSVPPPGPRHGFRAATLPELAGKNRSTPPPGMWRSFRAAALPAHAGTNRSVPPQGLRHGFRAATLHELAGENRSAPPPGLWRSFRATTLPERAGESRSVPPPGLRHGFRAAAPPRPCGGRPAAQAVACESKPLPHGEPTLESTTPPGAARANWRGPRERRAATSPGEPPAANAGQARKRGRDWETNGERRAAKAAARADALMAGLPREIAEMDAAADQVPLAAARRAIFRRLMLRKGGPEGDALHNALRAWRALAATARARELPRHGLPARDALVADVVAAEKAAAMAAKRGSRGGATVGDTFLAGFATLRAIGLPIEADGPLAEAAAALTRQEAVSDALVPRTQAGSMPIKMQLQLETLAAGGKPSVARTLSRALLVACVIHHVRLNDALEAIIFADERDPTRVVRGRSVMKGRKPKPVELFAPAAGWLGPFAWLTEHLAEMRGRPHAIPDYAGGQVAASTSLRPGIIAPAKARRTLGQLMAMAPLSMTPEEYARLGVTTHSPHGTGADMIRFMMSLGLPFTEEDARRLGHWLRDRNAPQHERGPVRSGPKQATAPGAPLARGAMPKVYSSGTNRRGERSEQLELRTRFADAIRAALVRFGRPWAELPLGTDDWDILRPA